MKHLKRTLIAFGVGLLFACQPSVIFGEPQPADTEPLSEIPRDYQGIYWCKVDSVSMFVDDHAFIKRKEFMIKLTKAEIDSSNDLELRNGRLFVSDWETDFPADEKGDTVISKIVIRDTIFSIRDEQILKPYKGHLIMNTKLEDNAWAVLVASHKGAGLLSLARAEIPENLEQLDSITALKKLTESNDFQKQIYITPTAKQFGYILERGVLFDTSCSEFERIIPLEEHIY